MKLLCFGSCNIDYVYTVDHIVVPGESESADGMQTFSGGKGLNQSIAIARAGAEVYHAGCIGRDGEFLKALLRESGVDVSFLKTIDGMTGHAIIQLTRAGENSIFVYPGANAKITREDVDSVLSHFGDGDILLLQNEISNIPYIVDRAYERGIETILVPAPYNEGILEIDFCKLSYLVLNQTEAAAVTGCKDEDAALDCFRKTYPHLKVILTLGKDGSVYQDAEARIYQQSFEVQAKDTTAAGDTFTGYFVAGLLKGMELKQSLELASCAAAISVSREGAAPSIPLFAEVEEALPRMRLCERNVESERQRRRIEKYLKTNMATASALELATLLGYSTVYTGVLVKKLFGIGYKELLLETRLLRAAELLRDPRMSIGEVVTAVGYENEGYFRKKFFEKYGKRPKEYRKEHEGKS